MWRTAAVVRAGHHIEAAHAAEADVAEAQAAVAPTMPRTARLGTLRLTRTVGTAPAWSGLGLG